MTKYEKVYMELKGHPYDVLLPEENVELLIRSMIDRIVLLEGKEDERDTTELIGCPFCGKREWLTWAFDGQGLDKAKCGHCHVTFFLHTQGEDTVKLWNRRGKE